MIDDLKTQYARGYWDAYANKQALESGAAYLRGYEQGRIDRLSDIHEDHKFDAMNDTGDE